MQWLPKMQFQKDNYWIRGNRMSVIIKDFGNKLECKNSAELKKNLFDLYTNQSITIMANKILHYVNVDKDGELVGTYTDQPIPLELFFE